MNPFHVQRRFLLPGRILAILAVALLQWALGSVRAGEVAVTLLHTNDLHQDLQRLAQIGAYVAEYRQQHPETLLLDAGDWLDRGSALVPLTRGEAMFGAMSRMGYDMQTPGNHDWFYGAGRLRELIAAYPKTTFLGTNLTSAELPLPANLVRTAVREFRGIRLGFLGLTLDSYRKDPRSAPELLEFCRSKAVRDRFHPAHHQRRMFTGDAIYYAGMSARYRPEDGTVDFSIDPARRYSLVVPWPFDEAAARKFRLQLPSREAVAKEPVIGGLAANRPTLLPATVRELLASAGARDRLSFPRRYAAPDLQWKPWAARFEAELKASSPSRD
jgi:hypothetical protein